jgi:myo-inositol-1(or 4)-monophosphatase
MKLLNLAARICNVFSMREFKEMLIVKKVKNNQNRDVVTELDLKLHDVSQQFMKQRMTGCKLLSEENAHLAINESEWSKGEWLIVDPLDGSNNYALGFPNYGYMAAHLKNSNFQGSVIVLPEYNQYIVLQNDQNIYAQEVQKNTNNEQAGKTIYYAYPPKQNKHAQKARSDLLDLIDSNSAGVYRYGSSCAGLYQLLCGKHSAFIGHEIRLWDAIAFFPVLTADGVKILYNINGHKITFLASKEDTFLESAEKILRKQQGLILLNFQNNDLKVGAR